MLAGQSGDVATARLLLQEGADPMEMTDVSCGTLTLSHTLFLHDMLGYPPLTIFILLSRCALQGLNSPLWLACNELNVDMVRLFLSHAPGAVNCESLVR